MFNTESIVSPLIQPLVRFQLQTRRLGGTLTGSFHRVQTLRPALLSAGGYHHHIGLNTWQSLRGAPPPPASTGLYHLAIAYPTRAELADALQRLLRAGIPLEGAAEHGVSEALYLRDPDGNGVEFYWDRPRPEWPHTPNGELAMVTELLNLESLLTAAKQVDQINRS
jgi:catechol 2,3-dioxygenase